MRPVLLFGIMLTAAALVIPAASVRGLQGDLTGSVPPAAEMESAGEAAEPGGAEQGAAEQEEAPGGGSAEKKAQGAPEEAAPEQAAAHGADTSPRGESPAETVSAGAASAQSVDRGITVRLLRGDAVEELTLRDYLLGVVAAEMPVTFEPEALKAQAVTARTYTLYRMERGVSHPDADVCDDFSHCSAYYSPEQLRERWGDDYGKNASKIAEAVDGTDGMVIKYGGELIDAVFHSTSSGRTESSQDVWGAARPYLLSVASAGEEASARYYGSFAFPADELREKLLEAFPGAELSESPEEWFTDVQRSDAGGVTTVKVGGEEATGAAVRSLLGLNSANFRISVRGDTVCFSTVGYGHGVGLSQFGANCMAKNGSSFGEILTHYYSGVTVERYVPGA